MKRCAVIVFAIVTIIVLQKQALLACGGECVGNVQVNCKDCDGLGGPYDTIANCQPPNADQSIEYVDNLGYLYTLTCVSGHGSCTSRNCTSLVQLSMSFYCNVNGMQTPVWKLVCCNGD